MGIIKDIDKGGGEVIRVEISEYKGSQYLNLRVWYTDKNTNELKPTQKGITVKPELYEELKAAILMAEGPVKEAMQKNPE
jgi:hypothetical protein